MVAQMVELLVDGLVATLVVYSADDLVEKSVASMVE